MAPPAAGKADWQLLGPSHNKIVCERISRYRSLTKKSLQEVQIHYLAALLHRTVPVEDVSLTTTYRRRSIIDHFAQDIRNEQPWLHVSYVYDGTQAVHFAAAALGGLQVASKAPLLFVKSVETDHSCSYLRLRFSRLDKNVSLVYQGHSTIVTESHTQGPLLQRR